MTVLQSAGFMRVFFSFIFFRISSPGDNVGGPDNFGEADDVELARLVSEVISWMSVKLRFLAEAM